MNTTPSPTPLPPRDDSSRRRPGPRALAVFLLVALNIAAQLGMNRGGLGNAVLNARHPTAHDAAEYVRGAEALARGDSFSATFGSGWRMPGYPFFLSFFHRTADEPLWAARVAQVLLTGLIPLIVFFTLTRLARSRSGSPSLLTACIGAAVATVWLPLYHYSSALLAEAPSLFLMFLLLLGLSRTSASPGATGLVRAIALGVMLATLIYLKPNHVLLLPPVIGFLLASGWNGGNSGRRAAIGNAAATLVMTLALVAPWSLFISRQHGSFIPLTLVSGYNLHLGSGTVPLGDPKALPFRMARSLGLQNEADTNAGRSALEEELSPALRDSAYALRARAAWSERPGAVAVHGAAKVFHTFGFSFRGARDGVMVLFFLAALAASILLWRERRHRMWVLFLGLSLLGVALQAFVYLPNQRFKTVLFDPPALLVLALGASCLFEKAGARRADESMTAITGQGNHRKRPPS